MIRIIKGSYGMVKRGTVIAVPAGSQPIELEPSKESRLVRLGVAEYVGGVKEVNEADAEQEAEGSEPEENGEDQETDGADPAAQDDTDELPAYSEDMKLAELKAVAEKYGVDASSMKSKKEVITAIEESKDIPDLGAADPVE